MEREVFDGVEKEYLLVAHSRSVGRVVSIQIFETIAKRDEVSSSQTAGRAIAVSGSANQR